MHANADANADEKSDDHTSRKQQPLPAAAFSFFGFNHR